MTQHDFFVATNIWRLLPLLLVLLELLDRSKRKLRQWSFGSVEALVVLEALDNRSFGYPSQKASTIAF